MSATLDIPYEIEIRGPRCVAFYERLIANGESPRLAEMLALRRAPSCVTDDTIFCGDKTGNQFANNPALGDAYASKLRAMGGSPAGKKYMHQLANEPGDPEAWVSSAGEIRALCQKRGFTCEGSVNVRRNKDCLDNGPRDDDYGVADDIVESELQFKLRRNPDLAPTPREVEDLRETIRAKRSPPYAKTPTKRPKKKKPLISLGK